MGETREQRGIETRNAGGAAAEAPDAAGPALHPGVRGARAVVFDVGGTLVHPDWERLSRLAAEVSGRTLAVEELRRTMKEVLRAVAVELQSGRRPFMCDDRPGWVFRRIYASLGVDAERGGRLDDSVQAAHGERHLWCDLDSEAPRVLAALRRAGLRLAVISNTEDGRLEELLGLAGIAGEFEFYLDSFVVGVHKPDAAIFRMALGRLDLAPADVVYVGDSYGHDALPALAAGMRAVLLDPLDLHPESVCPRIGALGELVGEARRRSGGGAAAGGQGTIE